MRYFYVILILVAVCAPAMAASQFVQWGATPMMTQMDANAYVVSSISLFDQNGKPFAAWSSQMSQFLAVPSNLGAEFRMVPNGIDPNAITKVRLSFDDGRTWYDATNEESLGWIVRLPLSDLSVGRVLTPQWGVEGRFRQNKVQVFLFIFRWESAQSMFGAFQFIVKETPEFYKSFDRYSMFTYGRSVEGAIPTWIEEPRVTWEDPASLVIRVSGTDNATFFVKQGEKVNKVVLRGRQMTGDLGCWNLAKAGEVVWKNLRAGSMYQIKPEIGEWNSVEIKEGCQTVVDLQKIVGHRPKASYPNFEWRILSGDPRYQEFQKYLGLIDSQSKAVDYFQSSYAAKDMNGLGLSRLEIVEIQRCAKENGIEEVPIEKGKILNSGLTFGRIMRVVRGPIRVNWSNAQRAIGYTPKGYNGIRKPVIIGRAFTAKGQEFPGCVNMFLLGESKAKWFVQANIIPGKCKMATLMPPNQPVGYNQPERLQFTMTQVQIAQFQVEYIQDINLNIEFNPKIDVKVLNDIFNNIDVTNTITNTITNNIINQIMNIINNANANNNG